MILLGSVPYRKFEEDLFCITIQVALVHGGRSRGSSCAMPRFMVEELRTGRPYQAGMGTAGQGGGWCCHRMTIRRSCGWTFMRWMMEDVEYSYLTMLGYDSHSNFIFFWLMVTPKRMQSLLRRSQPKIRTAPRRPREGKTEYHIDLGGEIKPRIPWDGNSEHVPVLGLLDKSECDGASSLLPLTR